MNARNAVAALVLLPIVGCGAIVRKPFTPPERGGPPWTEVTSAHFVLTTDLDRDDAERASTEMETMVDALTAVGFASEYKTQSRMDVVYFRHIEEYRAVAPKTSAGSFLWGGRHDFERTPLALVEGDFVQRTRETFQHELTHFLLHYYYPQAPTWLNEGLATYFETLEVNDGTATVGRQSTKVRFWRGPWHQTTDPTNPTEWVTKVPVSDASAASELAVMTPDQFYGNHDAEPNTEEAAKAFRVMATHYAGAWSLVYFLFKNPAYQPLFDDYLRRLQSGQKNDEAWRETLGGIPAEKLDTDYIAALAPREVLLLRTRYDRPNLPPSQVRALSSADVHVLWARLRRWDTAEDRAAASADIDAAHALDPGHRELALVLAYSLRGQGKLAEAEQLLRNAEKGHPGDARVLNGLGWVTLERLSKTDKQDRTAIVRAVEPVAARLAPIARTGAELDMLGRYHAMKGDPDAGLAYEKRAVAVDPSCVDCLASVAEMLLDKGLTRQALEVATFALALLPDGIPAPELTRQIADYRRQLSEAGELSDGRASKTGPKAAAPPSK